MSQPTLSELLDQLNLVNSAMENAGIESEDTINLQIMAEHIRVQIEMSAFEPLAAIADVAVPDFRRLHTLSAELQTEIKNEERRGTLLSRILSSVRNVLSLSGLPLP